MKSEKVIVRQLRKDDLLEFLVVDHVRVSEMVFWLEDHGVVLDVAVNEPYRLIGTYGEGQDFVMLATQRFANPFEATAISYRFYFSGSYVSTIGLLFRLAF